jgi:hypothetical protein
MVPLQFDFMFPSITEEKCIVAELFGEYSYLGSLAVERTYKYRTFTSSNLEQSIVHKVLRKGSTFVGLYLISMKLMFFMLN